MATVAKHVNTSPWYALKLRNFGAKSIITLIATFIVIVYLLPFFNMSLIAIKTQQQQKEDRVGGTVLPVTAAIYNYEGKDYPIFQVPTDTGMKEWALIDKKRNESQFIDPSNPGAGLIPWEGKWQTLEAVTPLIPTLATLEKPGTKLNSHACSSTR